MSLWTRTGGTRPPPIVLALLPPLHIATLPVQSRSSRRSGITLACKPEPSYLQAAPILPRLVDPLIHMDALAWDETDSRGTGPLCDGMLTEHNGATPPQWHCLTLFSDLMGPVSNVARLARIQSVTRPEAFPESLWCAKELQMVSELGRSLAAIIGEQRSTMMTLQVMTLRCSAPPAPRDLYKTWNHPHVVLNYTLFHPPPSRHHVAADWRYD